MYINYNSIRIYFIVRERLKIKLVHVITYSIADIKNHSLTSLSFLLLKIMGQKKASLLCTVAILENYFEQQQQQQKKRLTNQIQ